MSELLKVTVHGSSTCGLPRFIAFHARSTTYSGSSSGVSSGPRAPANMPVLM